VANPKLTLLDTAGKVVRTFGPTNSVYNFAWSPDGRRLVVSTEHVATIWSLEGIAEVPLVGCSRYSQSICWNQENRIVATFGDGDIRCWDGETSQLLWTALPLKSGNTVTFSLDGRIIDHSGKNVEQTVIYLVERTRGRIATLTPSASAKLRHPTAP